MMKLAALAILCLISWAADAAPKGQRGANGPKTEWRIDTTIGEQDLPTGRLAISIEGTLHLIDAKVPCALQKLATGDYKAHDVPKDAILACAGWWAGAGDEFYATREDGKLAIYHRQTDEGMDEKPAYQRVKVIALATP